MRPLLITVLLMAMFAASVSVAQSPPDDLFLQQQSAIAAAVEQVGESVVQIETIGGTEIAGEDVTGFPATGTVVAPGGWILTATYNLRHDPDAIFVTLGGADDASTAPDRIPAERIADDTSRKLTLLKIDRDDLVPITFAAPGEIRVGQTAIAVGKFDTASQPSVSVGIVSALGRVWEKAIQTDAKISRRNYGGPLLDLTGRTMGILVPLSPDADEVTSGAEWYDSGIGFAVPIDPASDAFAKLKSGEALRRGLTGIFFEQTDLYASNLSITFCQPKSPAGQAGIVSGDVVTSVGDSDVETVAQVRHALGPAYEGDSVAIQFKRGGETIVATLELAGEIDPYVQPAIGVLARNQNVEVEFAGAIVDFVMEDSPAAAAGVTAGDNITSVGGEIVDSMKSLRQSLSSLEIDVPTEVEVRRDGEAMPLSLTPAKQSAAPIEGFQANAGGKGKPRLVDIAISEASNKCFAIVPKVKDAEQGQAAPRGRALLVWVPLPGEVDRSAFVKRWQDAVNETGAIVVVPQAAGGQGWTPGESGFIAKAVGRIVKRYRVDTARVAIGGSGVGGAMAGYTAFSHRDLFTGAIVVDGPLPSAIPNFWSSPAQRLLAMVVSSNEEFKDVVEDQHEKLTEAGFAVHAHYADAPVDPAFYLDWLETIDRL